MNENITPVHIAVAVDILGLVIGLIIGFFVSKKTKNHGFRYGAFYSSFAAVSGAIIVLSPIIFFIDILSISLLCLLLPMNLLLAMAWIWLCMRAYSRRFWPFVTISIPPALGIWLIPLTIWNIYYGRNQRRSNNKGSSRACSDLNHG